VGIKCKLASIGATISDEIIAEQLAILQDPEPEQIFLEKFTLTTDEEILAPLLPFGTESIT
jgi:hypothetical protein